MLVKKINLILIICWQISAATFNPSISAFNTHNTNKCTSGWTHYNKITEVGPGSSTYVNSSGYICNTGTNNLGFTQNTVCNGSPSTMNDQNKVAQCRSFTQTNVTQNACLSSAGYYDFIYTPTLGVCCSLTADTGGTSGCISGYLRNGSNQPNLSGSGICGSGYGSTCKCYAPGTQKGYCYIDYGNFRGVNVIGMPAVAKQTSLTPWTTSSNTYAHPGSNNFSDITAFINSPPNSTFTFNYTQLGSQNSANIKQIKVGSGSTICNGSTPGSKCCGSITCQWQNLTKNNPTNWYDISANIYSPCDYCNYLNLLSSLPYSQKQFSQQLQQDMLDMRSKGLAQITSPSELRAYQIGTLIELINRQDKICSLCDTSCKSSNTQANFTGAADSSTSTCGSSISLLECSCSKLVAQFYATYCGCGTNCPTEKCSIPTTSGSKGGHVIKGISGTSSGTQSSSYSSVLFALIVRGLTPFVGNQQFTLPFYEFIADKLLTKIICNYGSIQCNVSSGSLSYLKSAKPLDSLFPPSTNSAGGCTTATTLSDNLINRLISFQKIFREEFNKSISQVDTYVNAKSTNEPTEDKTSFQYKANFVLQFLQLFNAILAEQPCCINEILWEDAYNYNREFAAAPNKALINEKYTSNSQLPLDLAYLLKTLSYILNYYASLNQVSAFGVSPTQHWQSINKVQSVSGTTGENS